MNHRDSQSSKKTLSKSKIKIEKGKLPPNFFKPLCITTDEKDQQSTQNDEVMLTPCFGLHTNPVYQSLEMSSTSPDKKEQFYSWFSKQAKSFSSRGKRTTDFQYENSADLLRNLTQRKRKSDRVKSVQQQKSRTPYKVLKKFDKLISNKTSLQTNSKQHQHFKFKPIKDIQQVERSFKDNFKVPPSMKRGAAEGKYRQLKALQSLSSAKPVNFLPSISKAL